MNFKKWVKSIQTAAYNGARTVVSFYFSGYTAFEGIKKLNDKQYGRTTK